MRYSLRNGLTYCQAGDVVIFLDLIQGRYFGLPARCQDAFLRLVDRKGAVESNDEDEIAVLLNNEILVETICDDSPLLPKISAIPRKDINDMDLGKASMPVMVRAVLWQVSTAFFLKICKISTVIEYIQRRSWGSQCEAESILGKLNSIVAAFESTNFMMGRTDRCLERSLAMFCACRSFGISVRVVIGVRSAPFSAHSWLERCDVVLNDTIDNIRNFTPILVLE